MTRRATTRRSGARAAPHVARSRRRTPPLSVAIVGCGRAGSALAAALADAGHPVRVWSRDPLRARTVARTARAEAQRHLPDLLDGVAVVLVAVRDAAIRGVASILDAAWPAERAPRIVLHLAGSLGAGELGPLAERAACGVFHPVVALTGARSRGAFAGSFATYSGAAPAQAAARHLVRRLGMRGIALDDDARPLAHLAMMMAAGDLVALLGEAERLLAAAGVRPDAARSLVATLAAGAAAGFEALGPIEGMTGPVVRGDVTTLRGHLAALDGLPSPVELASAAHRTLAAIAALRLCEAGRIDDEARRRILRLLSPRER